MYRIFIPVILLAMLAGCDQLGRIAGQIDTRAPLTNEEVIAGLREALIIGSDSASSRLARRDGYYRDELVRIMLPPEAAVITAHLALLPGGSQLVEDVVLRINRAAEDAAREAAPIFAGAVRNMTIADGFRILRGEEDAATQYLISQTRDQLYSLYHPKVNTSIEKPLVGNISTSEAWNTLVTQWNRVAVSPAGRMYGLTTVETDLAGYLTDQALDGLFIKLAREEARIRTDPAARVTSLLRRVFGRE